MEGTLRIQVIHVDGTRMIAQGTGGLSRGLMTEGVMSGKEMMSFVTINLSAMQRSENITEWINSLWGKGNKVPLKPEDWFKKGQVNTGQFTKPEG